MFENPRRGRQARNFTTNVPKILDLKSSSEQIFSENCRWVPLWKSPYLSEKFISKTKIFWAVEKKMNFMFDFIGIKKLEIFFCHEDFGHIFSLDHC